jgi:cytochrome b pre-mRNA-processing protein 3
MASLTRRIFDRLGIGGAARRAAGEAIYAIALERSRDPVFYRDWSIPDTIDGRFDCLCLHVFLVVHRLRRSAPGGDAAVRSVLERMIEDMDRTTRELGVGDLGVARRVRAMGEGLMGRIAAFDAAAQADDERGWIEVLRRNLYGGRSPGAAVEAAVLAYLRGMIAFLRVVPDVDLLAGRFVFAPVDLSRTTHGA